MVVTFLFNFDICIKLTSHINTHILSNSHINNLNDEEMITSHLICYIIKQLFNIKIKIS